MYKSTRKNRCLFWIPVLAALAFFGCKTMGNHEAQGFGAFDWEDPAAVHRAFIRTRGSLNPNEDVYFYWSGSIYARSVDPQSPINLRSSTKPILKFEGFNVARFEAHEGGVRMLSREISFYKDLEGNIIDCWMNPWTQEKNTVLHVFNDPVNFKLSTPRHTLVGDHVAWSINVNLAYPSPIPVAQYSKFSADDTYRSTEAFEFFASRSNLEDPSFNPVPVHMTWMRIGQFLPWMQMSQKPGELVYHIRGHKVLDGFDGLPKKLKDEVRRRAPNFEFAPKKYHRPNVTSWGYFKQKMLAGEYLKKCEQ